MGCQGLLRGSCDRGVILRLIDGRKTKEEL